MSPQKNKVLNGLGIANSRPGEGGGGGEEAAALVPLQISVVDRAIAAKICIKVECDVN